ncbi:hypothetical protein CEXT_554181 [Caerostris extrusa]|uniref:Uncharacterized protein n=1 Tax=Caerostris extrusa TaxID=172846 RepID=A0AAV4NFU2_CAEEX|nr:hypothetical protein CEXT_554181 [Caerostris extrusa]
MERSINLRLNHVQDALSHLNYRVSISEECTTHSALDDHFNHASWKNISTDEYAIPLYKENVFISLYEWNDEDPEDEQFLDFIEVVAGGKQRTIVFFLDAESTRMFYEHRSRQSEREAVAALLLSMDLLRRERNQHEALGAIQYLRSVLEELLRQRDAGNAILSSLRTEYNNPFCYTFFLLAF